MSARRLSNLRRIAEQELDRCFGNLPPDTRDELATTVVRQWVTYGGAAVVVTEQYHFKFQLARLEEGGSQVGLAVHPCTFTEHMRRSRIPEGQFPALLHQLNLRQRVRCATDYGQLLELRVDPARDTFHIEFVLDDDR